MGVSALFLLSSLGLAVLAQAQDCFKPVLGPTMTLTDEYITNNTFSDGSTATLKCTVGHQSAGGSRTITCTAGTWSSVRLKCERKSCGAAESVDNGDIKYDGNEFGDKATVVCRKGYRMIGNAVLLCGDQGWMGRVPTCEVVKCINPPLVQNGDFNPKLESYDFGHVVQYSCDAKYTLNGSKELTCSETENFSPSPPKCVLVSCDDPVIPNGEFVDGSRPPHGFMASITFGCKSGYEMKGSPSLTCDINSRWLPGIPQCIKTVLPTTKAPTIITTKKPSEASSTAKATTTSTPDTKKPAGVTPKPDDPHGGSPDPTIGLGIAAVVLVIATIGGVCYYYRAKKGRRGDNTDKEAAKDGEDLALAQA